MIRKDGHIRKAENKYLGYFTVTQVNTNQTIRIQRGTMLERINIRRVTPFSQPLRTVLAKFVEQLYFHKYDLDVIYRSFEYEVKKALDLNYKFVQRRKEKELNEKYTMPIKLLINMAEEMLVLTVWIHEETNSNRMCIQIEISYQEICNGSQMD